MAYATLGGYPGTRRVASRPTGPLGFQADPLRIFPPGKRQRLPLPAGIPEERALPRAQPKRLPLPGGSGLRGVPPRVVQGAARRAVSGAAMRLVPGIGTALLVADIGDQITEWAQPARNVPIPRDPAVPADVEMSWPANWQVTFGTWPSEGGGVSRAVIEHRDTTLKMWWLGTSLSNPANCPGGTGLTHFNQRTDLPLVGHGTVVSTDWPVNQRITEYTHFDAQPHHPGVIFSPSSHGFRQDYTARKLAPGDNPVYANPPRTTPGVGTPIEFPAASPGTELPTLWPSSAPARPVPIPAISPNPYLSPHEQPQFGPGAPSAPLPWEPPVIGLPGIDPGLVPGIGTPIDPGGPTDLELVPATITQTIVPGRQPVLDTDTTPRLEPRMRYRVGARVKERKVRLWKKGVVQAVYRGLNLATEALDLTKAAWGAIPKHLRPGYYTLHRKDGSTFLVRRWNASPQQRLETIMRHWDQMDMPKFFSNVLKQQVTDAAWANFSQQLVKAHVASGSHRPVGYETGPWDTVLGQQLEDLGAPEMGKDPISGAYDFVWGHLTGGR